MRWPNGSAQAAWAQSIAPCSRSSSAKSPSRSSCPQYANHPDFIRRFEAEAQLVARLEHPHIVPLYDYWREPGVAYLVMRLLRGGSLQQSAGTRGAAARPWSTRLLEQIGSALQRGPSGRRGPSGFETRPTSCSTKTQCLSGRLRHRQESGQSQPDDQTQAGMIIGSPAYISPEQIRSESVRPQTDIYAWA